MRARAIIHARNQGLWALPLALVGVCLQLAVLAASAHAAEYGELHRFPFATGAQPGHLNPNGEVDSFAVDPNDGSFYIADEPENGEYRIQRFNVKGEPQTSVAFKPPEAKHPGAEGGVLGEGGMQIAVDPARNRIYALLLYARREEKNTKEENEEKKECTEHPTTCYERSPLDYNELAAGELYGFEYKEGAGGVKELVSMKTETGTGDPLPILGEKGSDSFRDQGETPKEALLNPRGLAVDPATGNVVITGDEDQQENIKVEKAEGEKECRGVAQFVTIKEASSKVSASLGRRYVDKTDALDLERLTCGGAGEVDEYEAVPTSPIVTSGGRTLAEVKAERGINLGPEAEGDENQIWEIPTKDEPAATPGEELETTPTLLFTLDQEKSLVQFGAEEPAAPAMSFVPEEASTGKLYLAGITRHPKGLSGNPPPIALVLHYAESEPDKPAEAKAIGWTAGSVSEAGKSEECAIPPPVGNGPILLGGFRISPTEEGVIALDKFYNVATEQRSTEAFEFGPNGNGTKCPHASATTPVIEVGATHVSKLKPGEKATLSSEIGTADATHIEWRFENLTTKTAETPVALACPHEKQTGETAECTQEEEIGHASVEHIFQSEGEFKITEVIETDDLASPKIEATREVTIGLLPLEVELSLHSPLPAEQAGKFEATVVDHNETTPHLTYVWKFGDGTETRTGPTTEQATTTEHTYKTPCSPCTVTLEVSDEAGAHGEAKADITVDKSKAEEEREAREQAEREAIARHKAEEEAAAHKKAEEEAAKHKAEEEAAAHKKAEEEAAKHKAEEEAKKASSKPPTRAQLLAKALKLCEKQPKKKRAKCKATARKKYASKRKKHKRK